MSLVVTPKGEVQHVGAVRPVEEDHVPHRREALDAYHVLCKRIHDHEGLAALDVLWRAITHELPLK